MQKVLITTVPFGKQNRAPLNLLENAGIEYLINPLDKKLTEKVMQSGHLSGAAIDVFNKEPYEVMLKEIERCLLTAHIGSMSADCRTRMEIEATEEAIRFLTGNSLKGEVPMEEYSFQREGL